MKTNLNSRYYIENKEKAIKYAKQWKKENPEKLKEQRKRYKEKNKEKIREYQKEYREKNIKGRRGNNMSLNKSLEFLEKLKDKEGIDLGTINQMQNKIKSLDEALLLDVERLFERLHKPIRKVWYVAIKAKEEDVKRYEEMLDEIIGKAKIIFPEAKITISLCKDTMKLE